MYLPWLSTIASILSMLPDRAAAESNLTAQEAAELALVYAYPLLAYKKTYLALSPRLPINKIGHARQLKTPADQSVVKPNVDTLYSTVMFDVSRQDLILEIPDIPESQYALFSFHDLYGNNFAVVGKEDYSSPKRVRLSHTLANNTAVEASRYSAAPSETRLWSPTTVGHVLVRWLVDGDNLDSIHALQNATSSTTIPRPLESGERTLTSANTINWNASGPTKAEEALQLLCQLDEGNTPGKLANGLTVQETLAIAGFSDNATTSGVDMEAANRAATASATKAGEDALQNVNHGWSVLRPDIAGNFGDDYGLRMQVAFTGYLMLTSPSAVYPSWSDGTPSRPLEGQALHIGPDESYIYTFSRRPPLQGLGFWSLTAYNSEGFLIENPRKIYTVGDRSEITFPSGKPVYGPDASAEDDGPFQILVQPADVAPPTNWTQNWLPGPSGGGNLSVLLRWYDSAQQLLDGKYEYPRVTKQGAIRAE